LTEKVVFCGGGTGGHIYPIVSVYEDLKDIKKNNSRSIEFVYLVGKNSLEEQIAKKNQIRTLRIFNIGGMPRSLWLVPWLFKLLFASLQTLFLFLLEKPSLVFSTGGYSSAACLIVANILGIRYLLHNLDSKTGLANKVFLKNASALTYGIKPILKKKIVLKDGPVIFTGNPVRKSLRTVSREDINLDLNLDSKKKILLILGGSQGARFLNQLALQIAPALLRRNWQILHQLGPKQFDFFRDDFPNSQFYFPVKYFDNLDQIYAKVDLALSRAGAMTLTELCIKEIPTIMVPLPSSAQNHQYSNALYFSEEGAGLLVEEKNLNSKKLEALIEEIHTQSPIIKTKLQKIKNQIINANELITELLFLLLEQKDKK